MAQPETPNVPRATYRIQLNPQFTFAHLEGHLPYFNALGVSDLYLSPIFTATPGSTHGYDACDYTTVNEELGGRAGFDRLCASAKALNLGLVLDLVPNHMGISGTRNRWWRDVLELGRASPYADFFDIQWFKGNADGQPRVLLPLLAHQFGRELIEKKISLSYDGGFSLVYGDIQLPVSLSTYGRILEPLAMDEPEIAAVLISLSDHLRTAFAAPAEKKGVDWRSEIHGAKQQLVALLDSRPSLVALVMARVAQINASPGGELAALLDEQSYRLARWKTGFHEINYRRFFAINTLVGLRMEDPAVFAATHALLRELIRDRAITGLRIDHVDGLRRPKEYLARLQELALQERGRPIYLVVEKILGREEELPADWPVQGATGYEFIPQVAGVLVAAEAESAFTAFYQRYTGNAHDYPAAVVEKKELIMRELFADVIDVLASELAAIVADDLRWRDFTRQELAWALGQLIAQFSVYRTYADEQSQMSAPDRRLVDLACAEAIRLNPRADPQPLTFLRDLLVGDYPPATAAAVQGPRVREWRLTWQQYTGAIMAKAVEDTAFYTYGRFIALNEVGGDPGKFGGRVAEFHERNLRRSGRAPGTLLTTSTHDTKLSEDVRARLYALSELGPEWDEGCARWERLTLQHVAEVAGQPAPDATDRYRFFQVLLGAWPIDATAVDETFRVRLREHTRKAVREAKRYSSDLNPNEPYLVACDRFVDALLQPETGSDFLADFAPAAARVARLGFVNSLVQLVLKLTSPGMPDLYQGCDLWDFSLVDPDNRRPVDFALRTQALTDFVREKPADLLQCWRDGRIKLWTTQRLLRLRAEHPTLFAEGTYRPLTATGTFGAHVLAFGREAGGRALVVVVPRLTAAIGTPPVGSVWDQTQLDLPRAATEWCDCFTGNRFPAGSPVAVRELLGTLPFCVLSAEGSLSADERVSHRTE